MNLNSQSTLAKLLAKENVNVIHGNYSTAYFDVVNRTLGLPLWKDKGKDVYDLLVGHEVGHALFTPPEGWHESSIELNIPRSFINVIEDIRIEKLIMRQYPGLVGAFRRGYGVFHKEDFFGLNDLEVQDLALIDRINIKSKLRSYIEVDFSEEESPIVQKAFAVETFEEVLDVCKEIYEFMKSQEENKDENLENTMPESGDQNDSDLGQDDPNNEDKQDAKPESNPNSSNDGSQSDDQKAEDQAANQEQRVLSKDINEELTSITDDAFRAHEEELIDVDDRGYQPQAIRAITRDQFQDMMVPYSLIRKQRLRNYEEYKAFNKLDAEELDAEYKKFNAETKKFVLSIQKEFELRKAAQQHLRARTARTGSLDVDKLYNYKMTDDIFKQITTLADAKSHGLIMFIDYSGSMQNVIADVIKQTLILATFCKKVSIPFEIYGFTTGETGDFIEDQKRNSGVHVGHPYIDHGNIKILELLNSSMTKATYVEAYDWLYKQASALLSKNSYGSALTYIPSVERLGSTPLNETIMAARFILQNFHKKFKIQKVNALFLTDGESNRVYTSRSKDATKPTRGAVIDFGGRSIRVKHDSLITQELMKYIGDLGATVIGYYLTESQYDFKGQIFKVASGWVDDEDLKPLRKAFNKNKFISFDGVLGYDRYFLIKGEKNSLDTEVEELEIAPDAKKGEITRAFKKHAGSKKTNRLFSVQFAEMIA